MTTILSYIFKDSLHVKFVYNKQKAKGPQVITILVDRSFTNSLND